MEALMLFKYSSRIGKHKSGKKSRKNIRRSVHIWLSPFNLWTLLDQIYALIEALLWPS